MCTRAYTLECITSPGLACIGAIVQDLFNKGSAGWRNLTLEAKGKAAGFVDFDWMVRAGLIAAHLRIHVCVVWCKPCM